MVFKSSLDKVILNRTLRFCLFIPLPILFFNSFPYTEISTYSIIASVFFTVVIFISYLRKPKSILIGETQIIIDRLIGNIFLEKSDIKFIDIIRFNLLENVMKGGIFGYNLKANTEIGEVQFYTTKSDSFILLVKNNSEAIAISPDNPEKFIEEYNKI